MELHAGREYRIYMLGFLPGFPYLGGLDERLFTPRLASPRTAIPAGSVASAVSRPAFTQSPAGRLAADRPHAAEII